MTAEHTLPFVGGARPARSFVIGMLAPMTWLSSSASNRDLLTEKIGKFPRGGGSADAFVGLTLADVLEPARAVESLEHRRPPVVRRVRRADREHRRLLLRETHAVVATRPRCSARSPPFAAACRSPSAASRGTRSSRRPASSRAPVRRRARRLPRRAPAGSAVRSCPRATRARREDGEPAAELVAARKQRRGPAGGYEEEHDGEQRPARRDCERDGKSEAEDRDQDDGVHLRSARRVERQRDSRRSRGSRAKNASRRFRRNLLHPATRRAERGRKQPRRQVAQTPLSPPAGARPGVAAQVRRQRPRGRTGGLRPTAAPRTEASRPRSPGPPLPRATSS